LVASIHARITAAERALLSQKGAVLLCPFSLRHLRGSAWTETLIFSAQASAYMLAMLSPYGSYPTLALYVLPEKHLSMRVLFHLVLPSSSLSSRQPKLLP
jgi:hypothetical protein